MRAQILHSRAAAGHAFCQPQGHWYDICIYAYVYTYSKPLFVCACMLVYASICISELVVWPGFCWLYWLLSYVLGVLCVAV